MNSNHLVMSIAIKPHFRSGKLQKMDERFAFMCLTKHRIGPTDILRLFFLLLPMPKDKRYKRLDDGRTHSISPYCREGYVRTNPDRNLLPYSLYEYVVEARGNKEHVVTSSLAIPILLQF